MRGGKKSDFNLEFRSMLNSVRQLLRGPTTAGLLLSCALAIAMCAAGPCVIVSSTHAADDVEMTISIKDHKFDPSEVNVVAGKAIKLRSSKARRSRWRKSLPARGRRSFA